jgi:hypothetical protein
LLSHPALKVTGIVFSILVAISCAAYTMGFKVGVFNDYTMLFVG